MNPANRDKVRSSCPSLLSEFHPKALLEGSFPSDLRNFMEQGSPEVETDMLKALEEGQNEIARIDASYWELETGDNAMDALCISVC